MGPNGGLVMTGPMPRRRRPLAGQPNGHHEADPAALRSTAPEGARPSTLAADLEPPAPTGGQGADAGQLRGGGPVPVGAPGAAAAAAAALLRGGVVAVPTDTLYGLACDAAQPAAVEAIYRIKVGSPAP